MKRSVYLITGVAGFIGFNLGKKLLKKNNVVIGIDNYNSSYNPQLKKQTIKELKRFPRFTFYQGDILNKKLMKSIFEKHTIGRIIHLAGRTGVRKSLQYPKLYKRVNTQGTEVLYKLAIKNNCKQFIFASSGSVYGNTKNVPFKETQTHLSPTSPYAQSKKSAEEFLKKVHKKSGISTTILRFFSAYGPHGRPDMAPYLFTKAAFTNEKITQYGKGNTARDYTYIDDIVDGIIKAIEKPCDFEIINLGNNHPISLSQLIETIERVTKKTIQKTILPQRNEESKQTWADIRKAKKLLEWKPKTDFESGMKKFVKWFRQNRM